MYYAIAPTTPPTFVVQPNPGPLSEPQREELLAALRLHFMMPVALVYWDGDGNFASHGHPCGEEQAASEKLTWREFELAARDEELPF